VKMRKRTKNRMTWLRKHRRSRRTSWPMTKRKSRQ